MFFGRGPGPCSTLLGSYEAHSLDSLVALDAYRERFYIQMHRETLPPDSSLAWGRLNNVELNGVKISHLERRRGSGVVATLELSEDNAVLMTIPQELLLSLDNVWVYAKADRHLREVLEAVGDYARVL